MSKYQSIVLMGQAGTGKGTQAGKLAEHFGYNIFSTGDKAREIAAQDTPLGRAIADIHTEYWIPEWLASYMMTDALLGEKSHEGIVFESVARKPEEAKKLHEIHDTIGRTYIVVLLNADEETLQKRLLARNRPGYDIKEKIEQRRKAFEEETVQSLDFFEKQGKLVSVDASQDIDVVFQDILELLDK